MSVALGNRIVPVLGKLGHHLASGIFWLHVPEVLVFQWLPEAVPRQFVEPAEKEARQEARRQLGACLFRFHVGRLARRIIRERIEHQHGTASGKEYHEADVLVLSPRVR